MKFQVLFTSTVARGNLAEVQTNPPAAIASRSNSQKKACESEEGMCRDNESNWRKSEDSDDSKRKLENGQRLGSRKWEKGSDHARPENRSFRVLPRRGGAFFVRCALFLLWAEISAGINQLTRGISARKMLLPIVRNKFRNNPGILAQWETAARIVRPQRTPKSPSPPGN